MQGTLLSKLSWVAKVVEISSKFGMSNAMFCKWH